MATGSTNPQFPANDIDQFPKSAAEENDLSNDTPIEKSSDTDFPEGGTRAWLVACASAGVLFCTFGYVNAFGVYQDYYVSHLILDKSASDISWIGSTQTFLLFGGILFGGPLFDRLGHRMIWPPAITLVISVMLTSLCKSYYQFMLAQGILGGCSMGLTIAPAMASTAQYFHKNRGAALGLAIAGSSLGGVIFPIALSHMLYNPRLGFGWTVRICGFIILVLLLLSCSAVRARLPPREHDFFIPAAFKILKYDLLIAAGFFMMLGIFTPFFYLPLYATTTRGGGMSTQLSSYLIAILNGLSFFGRLLPGILADKLGALNMLFLFTLCTGILILCWQSMTTSAANIVFAALYGFFSGALLSLLSVSLTKIPRSPRDIGTYTGMGMAIISLGALAGPPITGALLARYGGFVQAQIFSGVVVIVGAFCVLVSKAAGSGLLSKS